MGAIETWVAGMARSYKRQGSVYERPMGANEAWIAAMARSYSA